VLFNDDYYPTLNRANVRLVTDGVERIDAGAVHTRAGASIAADVIIYATGFQATDFLAPMAIKGAGGRDLREEWRSGARAYLGVAVSGFPNLFLLYGPNTNLGHNSILVMIEAQVGYIIDAIRRLDEHKARRLDVKRGVMDDYNRWLQRDLAKSVWAADKQSWYKLADGTITNNWPHSTILYRRLLRTADLGAYELGG
jgi:cation diffusion facilitator CzcD-associated flavoprotein CzcO